MAVHINEPAVSTSTHDHFAELYDHDSDLIQNLGEFISDGIEADDQCIVIATASHLLALGAKLRELHVDLDAAADSGQYRALDASLLLPELMVNGLPDKAKFESTVSTLLDVPARSGKTRIFGELVALLWADENEAGAMLLEELWENILKRYAVSLFCAYPMHHFAGLGQANALKELRRLHSRVVMARPAQV